MPDRIWCNSSFNLQMELTPVKIRGKKRSATPKHALHLLLDPYSSGPAPSPMSEVKSRHHSHATSQSQNQRSLSFLERLPTELLEEIFLRCLNISLPRSSPILGQKLASNRTKSRLVLTACSAGTPGQRSGKTTEHILESPEELAETQSQILSLRWMDLSFFQRLVPEYMIEVLVRELSSRKLHWLGTDMTVTRGSEPIVRKYITAMFPPDKKELNPYHEVHWEEADPKRRIVLSLGLIDGLIGLYIIHADNTPDACRGETLKRRHNNKWRILLLTDGCRIPNKLLHGPWDDQKCEFLDIVIRSNASIDWDHTTSGEIAHEGFMEALRTRNARAVRSLLVRKYTEAVPGERKDFFFEQEFACSNIGIVPETRHLRYAVMQLDCDRAIVEALFTTPESKISPRDKEMWDWVHERKFYEDPRGSWLEAKLVELREREAKAKDLVPVSERDSSLYPSNSSRFFPGTRV